MHRGTTAYYARHDPREQALYQVVARHLPAFLGATEGEGLPAYVVKEFWAFLDCGVLERGAAVLLCDGCGARVFVPFSYKRRGFCGSCLGRR